MPIAGAEKGPEALIRVTFVLLPRFNMMTLTGLVEPLRIANYLSPAPQFQWRFISPEPGQVIASNGMKQDCDTFFDDPSDAGIIFVVGSWGSEHYVSRTLINWVSSSCNFCWRISAANDVVSAVSARPKFMMQKRGRFSQSTTVMSNSIRGVNCSNYYEETSGTKSFLFVLRTCLKKVIS